MHAAALGGAALLVVATALSLWVQSWSAGGEAFSTDTIRSVLTESRFGDIWLYRAALSLGALVSAAVALRFDDAPWRLPLLSAANSTWLVLLLVALSVPVTTSLNSHAESLGSSEIETAIDWAHLVAAGLWGGALFVLLATLLAVVPHLEDRAAFVGPLVRRFSLVAVPTVLVIVATGAYQAVARLADFSELFDSRYGNAIVAKSAILGVVLLIAALNLLIIGPRLLAFARERAAGLGARIWELRLRLTVGAELALIAVILVATAVLTNTPPPTGGAIQAAGGSVPYLEAGTPVTTSAGDLSITVWADPGRVGPNQLNVLLRPTSGSLGEVQQVILRLTYKDEDIGTSEERAQPVHPPEHYIAETSQLTFPGQWEVEVIVRRTGLLDARGTVTLTVGA
jgi:copper transport protein